MKYQYKVYWTLNNKKIYRNHKTKTKQSLKFKYTVNSNHNTSPHPTLTQGEMWKEKVIKNKIQEKHTIEIRDGGNKTFDENKDLSMEEIMFKQVDFS